MPEAYHRRGLCYECKPGSKGRPLPCRGCGSAGEYWSAGRRRRCHQYAPQLTGSCRDCFAWGVGRIRNWTCKACRAWHAWYPATGICISCYRGLHLNPHQACRLCWMQAKLARPDEGPVNVIAGNRFGLILLDLPARPVRTVLAEARMLTEDRPSPVQSWFEQRIAGLSDSMTSELRVWFDVLHHGSATPPRCRPRAPKTMPRAPKTIKTRMLWALPTLHSWADAGHQSLREVTREQILAALPPSGTPRLKLGGALKSIFSTLNARRVIFTNPVARIHIGNFERRIPLPADPAKLAAVLNSADPPTAAVAALMIFHGLRPAELRALQLTGIRDGRCYLPDRTVLLPGPVRTRLAAYLDYRHRRWPATINPHFFIHYISAPTTGPVGRCWVNGLLGMPARVLRQDRIIDETVAAAGDLRRICDLFGVTIATAQHYTTVLSHPALASDASPPA